ncbi:MAG: hypothetical protein QCI82_06905 [Candidatus Thermoplasmatota archaeon]|nr:hypothetical protein [Candidatus Thermoplasmatota archaeon]
MNRKETATPSAPTTIEMTFWDLKDERSVNSPEWNMITMIPKSMKRDMSWSIERMFSSKGERTNPPMTSSTIEESPSRFARRTSNLRTSRFKSWAIRISSTGEKNPRLRYHSSIEILF